MGWCEWDGVARVVDVGEECVNEEGVKKNRPHTHTQTPIENNTPDTDTDTHTRQKQHPKRPNKHPPQTLNNARRWRDDGVNGMV